MKIIKKALSNDGYTVKYLQKTKDNYVIETSYFNLDEHIICISSQIGCPMGCSFCISSTPIKNLIKKKSFIRNLTCDEIVQQVKNVINQIDNLNSKKILFSYMGGGEPFLNYDNVIKSIKTLSKEFINSRTTISTVGVSSKLMRRLANEDINTLLKLHLSLHSPDNFRRCKLLPKSKKIKPLLDALDYFSKRKNFISKVNYSLIKGINDSEEDAIKLVKLLKPYSFIVKLSKLNSFNNFESSEESRFRIFERILANSGIKTCRFSSEGIDIMAGCGQLMKHFYSNFNKDMTTILGIESTAHTFGVGIVKNSKILANIKDSYTTESGGIIPIESAKHHEKIKDEVYRKAIETAKIDEKQINAIAFSNAPGLAPCLLVGLKFTKELAKKLNLPVIPVNHCIAHLEIGRLTGAKDPVLLYCSGANTQIIAYAAGKYRIFGETLDLGIGNFIDTFARYAGIGFPGGPKIQELAKSGKYLELPYSIKGMDVAFSGMLTKLRQMLQRGYKIEDLSYSLQETAFSMLIEAAERALAHTNKSELLLGGGVACNTRLKEMARIMCQERGAKLFVPENSLLVDNAGMIAYLGEIMLNSGIKISEKDIEKLDIKPRERTDEVQVSWKN